MYYVISSVNVCHLVQQMSAFICLFFSCPCLLVLSIVIDWGHSSTSECPAASYNLFSHQAITKFSVKEQLINGTWQADRPIQSSICGHRLSIYPPFHKFIYPSVLAPSPTTDLGINGVFPCVCISVFVFAGYTHAPEVNLFASDSVYVCLLMLRFFIYDSRPCGTITYTVCI